LDEGVRVLADCGWSVEDALTAATDAPAAIVNETTPNDAVLWDDQLRVRLTVVDGHVAYRDAELPVGLS
jgi:N-acetylglucosamine-6-phosphate deacetylase